jgi:S-adenosylmethionine:tRNA ribosyltransferase-isomerase
MAHARVSDLPKWLDSGDLLVVNDTRVFPARLLGRRVPSGGAVECLLMQRVEPEDLDGSRPPRCVNPTDQVWEALMHAGQKLKPAAKVRFDADTPFFAEVLERRTFGRRLIRLWTEGGRSIDDVVDSTGHVPLPPYIRRGDVAEDRARYQTVFADRRGSVAAPTAGLHFSPPLIEALRLAGVGIAAITLHVGYGTFQPVRVAVVEEHRLERERFVIGESAARAIAAARHEGRRVVAVGTTVTRTLEAVAQANQGVVVPGEGATDLFIYPGFTFRVISGLLTNFHLPQSSLLMLVAAFAGLPLVRVAYDVAVAERYRFYSYGDAMLIT